MTMKMVGVRIDSDDLEKIDKIARAKTVENDGEPVTRSDVIRGWIYKGFEKELKKTTTEVVPA